MIVLNISMRAAIGAALALGGVSALWFMIWRAGKWAAFVDRENDFWFRKGFSSQATAEKFKKIEKGPVMKLLALVVAVLGILILIMELTSGRAMASHPPLRLPYNPALKPVPVKSAITKPPTIPKKPPTAVKKIL